MKRPNHRRRGSLYVAVLGVSLLVGVMAITASTVGRATLRSAAEGDDRRLAAQHAASGLEYALVWLNRHPDWRDTLTNGAEQAMVYPNGLDEGGFTWSVTDADGDLADDARDHAVLRSIGVSGGVRHVLEAGIEPAGRGLTCLETSALAINNATLAEEAVVAGSGILAANKKVTVGEDVSCSLAIEAGTTVMTDEYSGPYTEAYPERETPGDHVFDWYLARGTEIDIEDLATNSNYTDARQTWVAVLSKESNPFGETNPWGIYWIDCEGQSVILSWTRLYGTLVLLNAGPDTRFTSVALFQPEALNHPSLLVDGDLTIDMEGLYTGQTLYETYLTNYNPEGTPYNGESDDDQNDSYAASLDGIVYATGDVTVTDAATINGVLIAKSLTVESDQTLTVNYRPYSLNYPPPGFSAGQGVRLLPGTVRRVAY